MFIKITPQDTYSEFIRSVEMSTLLLTTGPVLALVRVVVSAFTSRRPKSKAACLYSSQSALCSIVVVLRAEKRESTTRERDIRYLPTVVLTRGRYSSPCYALYPESTPILEPMLQAGLIRIILCNGTNDHCARIGDARRPSSVEDRRTDLQRCAPRPDGAVPRGTPGGVTDGKNRVCTRRFEFDSPRPCRQRR